jgi:Rrf2 family protein
VKLSKTSEYALRILSFMAKDKDKVYSAKILVENLKISDKYLRSLMTNLSKQGFIKSLQGREGGYVFAKELKDIYFLDIIQAIEGTKKFFGCIMGFESCDCQNPCILHNSLVKLREDFVLTISKKSLADIDFNNLMKI